MERDSRSTSKKPIDGFMAKQDLVECHSGYEYAQRPVALYWEGKRFAIEAVEAEWRGPGGRFFRVRIFGGWVFELFYSDFDDEWRVTPA